MSSLSPEATTFYNIFIYFVYHANINSTIAEQKQDIFIPENESLWWCLQGLYLQNKIVICIIVGHC